MHPGPLALLDVIDQHAHAVLLAALAEDERAKRNDQALTFWRGQTRCYRTEPDPWWSEFRSPVHHHQDG